MLPVVAVRWISMTAMACVLTFWTSAVSAQNQTTSGVRKAYRVACASPESESIVQEFIAATEQLSSTEIDPWMMQGMRATAHIMLAESMVNPF